MIVSGEYGEDQNARVLIEIFMKARHGWRIRSWQSQKKREGLELCLHPRNVRKVIFLLRVCSSKPRVISRQRSYYRRNEHYKKKSTWGFRILKGIGDDNGETRCLRNAGSSNVSFLTRVRKTLMKSWKGISYSCRNQWLQFYAVTFRWRQRTDKLAEWDIMGATFLSRVIKQRN